MTDVVSVIAIYQQLHGDGYFKEGRVGIADGGELPANALSNLDGPQTREFS